MCCREPLYQLEHQAAADGLLTDHLRIHKQGRETRTARGIMVGVSAAVMLFVVLVLARAAPWYAWAGLGLVLVPALARAGRPG